MAITTSQNIILDILPLFNNKNMHFASFKSVEKANGFMPTIEVVMNTTEDLAFVGDVQNIKIITSYGSSFETKAYVYSINYVNGICTIKMMPVVPDFMRTVKTATYKGGENALSSVWKGNIDKNITSDILNSVPLYQKSETDYSFINRILRAYKFNSIFAYTIGGLIIRDLSSANFVLTKNRQGETKPISTQEISDPKRYSSTVEVLERFTNHIKIRVYDKVFDVNKEYESLIGNSAYFERFKSAKSDYSFTTVELYPSNLCEGIQYYSNDTKVENTFIEARTIEFKQSDVKITYNMRSINP